MHQKDIGILELEQLIAANKEAHGQFKDKLRSLRCSSHPDKPARTYSFTKRLFFCPGCDVDFTLRQDSRISLENDFDGREIYEEVEENKSTLRMLVTQFLQQTAGPLQALSTTILQVAATIRGQVEQSQFDIMQVVYKQAYGKVGQLLQLKQQLMQGRISGQTLCDSFIRIIESCKLKRQVGYKASFSTALDSVLSKVEAEVRSAASPGEIEALTRQFAESFLSAIGADQSVKGSERVKEGKILYSGEGELRLKDPFCCVMTHSKKLYVGDFGNCRVLECDLQEGKTRVLMKGVQASGLTLDEEENLVICEQSNHRVSRFDRTRNILKILAGTGEKGSSLRHLDSPNGVCLTKDCLLVCDSGNHRVLKVALSELGPAAVDVVAGNGRAGTSLQQLNYPTGVLLLGNNRTMLICDFNNDRLLEWEVGSKAGIKVDLTLRLQRPFAIVTVRQTVYVSDQFGHRLVAFDRDSPNADQLRHSWLRDPRGLWGASFGSIFVACQTTNSILQLILN